MSHFHWPREISALDEEMKPVLVSNLPPEISRGIQTENQEGTTDALYFDLNGDGVKELIVNDGMGGSGGPGYQIWQRSHGKWAVIADFQGGITLCQKANGYYQLEVESSGGAEATNKALYRFVNGRYRAVRSENYKAGRFVRALDANELKSLKP